VTRIEILDALVSVNTLVVHFSVSRKADAVVRSLRVRAARVDSADAFLSAFVNILTALSVTFEASITGENIRAVSVATSRLGVAVVSSNTFILIFTAISIADKALVTGATVASNSILAA